MSYNGIGLSSAKGTGTSGHIQRSITNARSKENRKSKGKHFYNRQLQSSKLESLEKVKKLSTLSVDENIINHEFKRELEIKVMEFRDKCEDENPDFDDDQIDQLVDAYRIKLLKSGNGRRVRRAQSYNVSINPFSENKNKGKVEEKQDKKDEEEVHKDTKPSDSDNDNDNDNDNDDDK